MSIINVGKCRRLIDIEELLSRVENKLEKDKIVFPVEFFSARHSPMHDASRLQMVVTLVRKHLQGDYLDLSPNITDRQVAINSVCSYAPGITGVRLTKGLRFGKNEVGRREVLKSAIEKMQATDAGEFNKVVQGRIIDLTCVAASKVQYLRPIFSSPSIAKEYTDMRKSMKILIDFVNQQSKDRVPESIIDALGLFSSELIQNTQEHAITNFIGEPYLEHVEGMFLGWTRLKENLFSEDFMGNEKLNEYWVDESEKTESGEVSLRAFVISYFDSGPGLVSRYTGKSVSSMSLKEEKGFLLSCLAHKVSSKPEDAAGEGLPSVLSELQKIGGLIRIRSGRLSVFNSFTQGDSQREIFDFEDWTNTSLSPVEGTVISILIPLRAD